MDMLRLAGEVKEWERQVAVTFSEVDIMIVDFRIIITILIIT